MFLYTPSCRTIFCLYVWLSIIVDHPVIASDNCMQKYAHCIALCSLRTSGLYNIAYSIMVVKMYKVLHQKYINDLPWLSYIHEMLINCGPGAVFIKRS